MAPAKYPDIYSRTIRPHPERKTVLITYQKLWSGTYVEGAMSRQTGVCCQSYAKATMQCFACPFRSAEMLTLRRFYAEAKKKALALSQ